MTADDDQISDDQIAYDQITYDFDVCVIGAGPAGFAAAIRAWDLGKRVCLVEKDAVGGVGLANGALSSKTMWELSRDYRLACSTDRGFRARDVTVDYPQVVRVVANAVEERAGQMRRQLEALAEPRPSHPGAITMAHGTATFRGPHELFVDGRESGSNQTIRAANYVIATGGRPRTLDYEVDGERILTSDHLMGLKAFPRSLVVLGAGVVGCEFATIFAGFGQTKVNIIDRQSRILPFEDADIAHTCSTNLERQGVTIHHRATLLSLRTVDDEVEYEIEHHRGGREAIRVEKALISIGRLPNTDTLGLDEIGVKLDPGGYIVDDDGRTSVPHIWAAGDVTKDVALVSVGEMEGRHVVERMFELPVEPLRYDNLCSIYFLDPEVASVGMNEQQAQEARIPYRVAIYGYPLVNRAVAMRATDGFIKILVSDDDDMCVLGMRAVGVHASTTIEAIALIMHIGASIRDIARLMHPHPAVTEAVQECARMLLGSSIYKPEVFPEHLRLARISYGPEDGEPTSEKPADEKPADAKPASAKPADEKPADARPAS